MANTGKKPVGFRISARTILQLGGELISSDGIAFYELIKNAVDAGSKKVFVDVCMQIPLDLSDRVKTLAQKASEGDSISKPEMTNLKNELIEAIAPDSPNLDSLRGDLRGATTLRELLDIAIEANSITFRDSGSGMTLEDLQEIYLTVGTPFRLNQRKAGSSKVILGEKGIGRLSAMRLGNRLFVKTATDDDSHWNNLRIDWNDFARDTNQLLEEVPVAPARGDKKDGTTNGTSIRISDLTSTWTIRKLAHIANSDLSRFTDPFAQSARYPVHLRFNGTAVPIPRMDEILAENAHALIEARLVFDKPKKGNITLSGQVQYLVSGATGHKLSGKSLDFSYTDVELSSLLAVKDDPDLDIDTLERLGSFTMKCLWFNRRILKAIVVDDTLLDLKKLVRQWSGGLMVYRDGFRVPPYGGADDDWLDLDRGALASQGYKVNRTQLVGKVDISAAGNPFLKDQTNREGLRDCTEKRALVWLLKHVLEGEFRLYLKEVDEEIRDRDRIEFSALSEKLVGVEETINSSLEALIEIDDENPELEIGTLSKRLEKAFQTVVSIVSEVQDTVETVEDEKARVLHLAALGLSIEKLAHELNRASKHALEALSQIDVHTSGAALKRTAFLQLQSLRKRLQNLDPLLTPTRQRKEEFDLVTEVESVLSGFEAKFTRHNVRARIVKHTDGPVTVKLVRAMVIQVLENLIDNSVYWLTVGKRHKGTDEKSREITILIDGSRNVIEVSDNGPGIAPENRDRIFKPFFTLKPAGHGKGLGLYISREIAEYHGGTLRLLEKGLKATGRLRTFEFDFSSGRV